MKIKIDDKEYTLIPLKRDEQKWEPFGPGGAFAGTISTQKYKCPLCGKGMYVHVDENTPGDRDSYSYLECENCDPEQVLYSNAGLSSWDLKTNTPEEVAYIKELRSMYQF